MKIFVQNPYLYNSNKYLYVLVTCRHMTAAVEDQENNQVNPQVNTPGNTQAPPQ